MSGSVLLLVVGVVRKISIASAKIGAKGFGWSDDRLVEEVDFSSRWKAQGATNRADILSLQQEVRARLKRCIERHPVEQVPEVIVASLAPMTVMTEVGEFMRSHGYTVRVLDHDRDRDDWQWGVPRGLTLKETVWSPTLPTAVSASAGPVTVVVSVSGVPSLLDIQAALGRHPEQVAHISVSTPGRGVISCEAEARLVAAEFRRVFDTMRAWFPVHDSIHLFLAVPPSVGVLLGVSLQVTFGRNLTVYESVTDGQVRRFVPGGIFLSERPLGGASDAIPDQAVEATASDLRTVVRQLGAAAGQAGMKGWFARVVPTQAAPNLATRLQQAHAFRRFDGLDPAAITNLQVVVSADMSEFTWVSADHQLTIGRQLAGAIAGGLADAQLPGFSPDEARQTYLRLFVLHEWCHIVQNLDEENALRVGRFPRCLEDLDWWADVFALCFNVHFIGSRQLKSYLLDVMTIMLMGLVSFQPKPSDPASCFMQVRRLNRYLTWMVQFHRIASMVESDPSADRLWDVVASRPIVELATDEVLIRDERVVVDLDRLSQMPGLELGIVIDGQLVRQGQVTSVDLKAFLSHLRNHRCREAIRALKGLQNLFRNQDAYRPG